MFMIKFFLPLSLRFFLRPGALCECLVHVCVSMSVCMGVCVCIFVLTVLLCVCVYDTVCV